MALPQFYGLRELERRYRVPMPVFLRIYHAIKDRLFWVQSVYATGRPQAHPLQKRVAAFRVLRYGESRDRADEYVLFSSSTIYRAVTLFTEFIVDEFSPRYLRRPTTAENGNILGRNAARGLPGCLGSLDCSDGPWYACPKGREGTYQGRDGQRSIAIEAIFDEDTWIYHIFAGCPGSLNDTNVLYQSPLYMDVITGKRPPRDCRFTVNGHARTLLYYLVDGIYPRFGFFVAPYLNPQSREQRTFNRLQEALRKDVEHLFRIRTARFHSMLHPCRYWSVPRMALSTQAVAILHTWLSSAAATGSSRGRGLQFMGGVAVGQSGRGPPERQRRMGRTGKAAPPMRGPPQARAPPVAEGEGRTVVVRAASTRARAPPVTDVERRVVVVQAAPTRARAPPVPAPGAGGGGGAGGADAGSGSVGGGAGAGGDVNTGAVGVCAGALRDLEQTPGVPSPHVEGAPVAPISEFMHILMATGEATSVAEHEALRDDLCAHVFAQRGELLEPYVD